MSQYYHLDPLITEETFKYLPIVAQISNYYFTDRTISCFGWYYAVLDLSIGLVNIPEFITLELELINHDLIGTPIIVGTIQLEPGDSIIERFKHIKIPAGWYERDYELIARVPGLNIVRSLLKFKVGCDKLIYPPSSYIKNLSKLFKQGDHKLWGTLLTTHLGIQLHHNILNYSGIHTLMVMYYLDVKLRIKLQPIMKYLFDIISLSNDETQILIYCSKNVDPKFGSQRLLFDLINELQGPILRGYISLETFIPILNSIHTIVK